MKTGKHLVRQALRIFGMDVHNRARMPATIPQILLVQRAPVEGYPPVLHQARILSTLGKVTVLDSGSFPVGSAFLTPGEVRRVRMPANNGSGIVSERIGRLRSALSFRRGFIREMATAPDVVIAFEPEAAAMLLNQRRLSRPGPLRIVHLHEHPTEGAYASSAFGRLALRRTLSRLRNADVVVVADAHRSAKLAQSADLASPPLVVMNCPMLLHHLPPSKLTSFARERGLEGAIVHYHGSVGPDHGLEATIVSMQWWPPDAGFFIVGGGSAEYVASLRRIASSVGVEPRVVFVGRIPYDEVFLFTAGATVGMSMLDTTKPNWRYAAGASNKRFEYMALGIPQVTSDGPGISELFGKTGVALMADPTDPPSVAESVNRYLESPELRASASLEARRLHLGELNYERQFEPIVNRIREDLLVR